MAALAMLISVALLATRPLTTLTVVGIGFGIALIACGGWIAINRRDLTGILLGAILILGGIAALQWRGFVTPYLPYIACLTIAALALRSLIIAARSSHRGGIVRSAAALMIAGCLTFIAVRWPDVAALLTAGIFLGLLIWCAALVVIPPPRRASRGIMVSAITLSAALLVGGVSVGGVLLDAQQSRPDSFYSWDGVLPTKPGVLLKSAAYDGKTPEGSQSFRILYTTRDVQNTMRIASAVIALPTATADQPRTVLAWQHGTTGVAVGCAPSLSPDALTDIAIPGIDGAIARGWAVVATDYPGQGTSGPYPYLVGVGEGRATLDGVRALQQVEQANTSDQVFLWGHSQGGHATLWAADIAESYAPELNVMGVAGLSAASDPHALAADVVSHGPSPVTSLIFSYVLIPYSDAYPDVVLRDSVDPAGAAFPRAAASRCATSPNTLITILASSALLKDRPLYTLDLNGSPASERLRENTTHANFTAPLFLGQGVDDEVVPIEIQRALAAKVCTEDRSVTVREYPGKSHMGVIAPESPLISDLYTWADQVLKGDAPAGCHNGN